VTGRAPQPDPLGRRALFEAVPVGPPGQPAAGKRALFSGSGPVAADAGRDLAARGGVVVECSSCRAVSRLGPLDLVLASLPVPLWVPGRRFDRRLRCPACRHRTWASVSCRARRED